MKSTNAEKKHSSWSKSTKKEILGTKTLMPRRIQRFWIIDDNGANFGLASIESSNRAARLKLKINFQLSDIYFRKVLTALVDTISVTNQSKENYPPAIFSQLKSIFSEDCRKRWQQGNFATKKENKQVTSKIVRLMKNRETSKNSVNKFKRYSPLSSGVLPSSIELFWPTCSLKKAYEWTKI